MGPSVRLPQHPADAAKAIDVRRAGTACDTLPRGHYSPLQQAQLSPRQSGRLCCRWHRGSQRCAGAPAPRAGYAVVTLDPVPFVVPSAKLFQATRGFCYRPELAKLLRPAGCLRCAEPAFCETGSGGSAVGGDDSAAGQQRRAKKAQALCRPVICVCNDLYARVIRPLRDVAVTFQFKQPMVRGIALTGMYGLPGRDILVLCCSLCIIAMFAG